MDGVSLVMQPGIDESHLSTLGCGLLQSDRYSQIAIVSIYCQQECAKLFILLHSPEISIAEFFHASLSMFETQNQEEYEAR